MKPPKILFLQGGWDGQKPEQIIHKFPTAPIGHGCKAETITSLERLAGTDWLQTFDVISACWTMGPLSFKKIVSGSRERADRGSSR